MLTTQAVDPALVDKAVKKAITELVRAANKHIDSLPSLSKNERYVLRGVIDAMEWYANDKITRESDPDLFIDAEVLVRSRL